jgi:hypothetical protein
MSQTVKEKICELKQKEFKEPNPMCLTMWIQLRIIMAEVRGFSETGGFVMVIRTGL